MTDHDHHPLHFVSPEDDATTGPLTIEPETAADGRVFDAITDMFLGPVPSEQRDEPDDAWRVEMLVMGHLPVRARPWASQYAAALAEREHARVVLIRIGAGYASVELFGSAKGTLGLSVASDLADAIHRARALASICLVQADDSMTRSLVEHQFIDSFTFLVGANEAAVVDAYRAMKSVAQQRGGVLPEIRIGVMGTDDEHAEQAVHKLNEAARAFLDHRIVSSLAIERMGPTGAVSLFGDRVSLSPEALMTMLEGVETTIDTGSPQFEEKPIAEPVFEAPAPPPNDAPDPLDAPAENLFTTSETPDLLELVGGLEALDLTCPYDAESVLAIDRDGVLHVVRRCHGDAEALLMTLDWAEHHRHILSRATNGRVRPDRVVVAHAMVDRSALATAIHAVGDTRVRAHTLVRIPDGARWMSREL